MADAFEDHKRTVSTRGRTITNLCFTDDIDGLSGQEQELAKLASHLEEASISCGMQISAKKTQLVRNNTNGIITDITIDNKKLGTIRSFRYLGAIVSDEGSKPEVLSRIAQTIAAVTKLKVIKIDKNICTKNKTKQNKNRQSGSADPEPYHLQRGQNTSPLLVQRSLEERKRWIPGTP